MHAEAAATLSTINWWAWESEKLPMGWFIVDFAVFVSLILYATWTPLKAALAERHDSIQRAVSQAATAHAKASRAHQELERLLANMEAEAEALVRKSRNDGEAERAQMEAQANAFADRLAGESASLVDESVRRTEQRLRQRLLSRALAEAEREVRSHIQPADQARLLDDAIDQLAHVGLVADGTKGAVG